RDWSSDVCSSDLVTVLLPLLVRLPEIFTPLPSVPLPFTTTLIRVVLPLMSTPLPFPVAIPVRVVVPFRPLAFIFISSRLTPFPCWLIPVILAFPVPVIFQKLFILLP